MFNKYVWKLYLEAGGQETVELFRKNICGSLSEEYIRRISELQRVYCVSDGIIKETERLQNGLYDAIKDQMTDAENEEGMDFSDEEMEDLFSEIYDDNFTNMSSRSEKETFGYFIDGLAYFSTLLALQTCGSFIPYYFFGTYNVLAMIAEAFDIALAPVPKKADYKGRVWHYLRLCIALNKFRRENDLSPFELCAFLYDFAPNYIGGSDSYILKELPEPTSAFFIGGGGDNADATAEDDPEKIAFWQCSPDTRAGDMIVMYLKTPISAISSIWRSYSVGFIDPFFYYYRCTYIGRPNKINRISLDEIKSDKILGKMAIVNKNMQGINGIELLPSDYNHIVEISNANVPKLEYVIEDGKGGYVNEKAVEEKLIKPLLSELGFGEADYVQQLSVPIGNHNRALIPDFVLLPECSGGHYSAFTIIEAKRSIMDSKQLEDAKIQARSYAKLLGVRYSVVASQEGIWVSAARDDYSEDIMVSSWEELKDSDTFYKLGRLIRKDL